MTCECKDMENAIPVPDEFMAFACVECGRVWVNELTGGMWRTYRFYKIPKPMGGVWSGQTFMKEKTGRLASTLLTIKQRGCIR